MRILGSKRRAGLAGLVALVTGFALTAVAFAAVTFGPDRPTFSWSKPATYITFNSMTDNPVWGDERFLVKARDASTASSNNSTSVNVKDNQELLVTVHFHNNAAANLNLVARDTRVKMDLPSGSAANQELKASISASNATPQTVFSTMDLKGERPFTLEYVPGSARLITNKVSGAVVSDSVVSTGALIGTSGTDGNVPGCAAQSGYVTIKVKVKMPQPAPEAKFACKALDVTKVDRTRFTFTATAEAENATIQSYVFTTKNSAGTTVDTTTVNTNAKTAVYNFNQSTAGTYTVSVVVNTDKGSTSVKDVCTKQVTVEAAPTPPPAPAPAPTPPQVQGAVTPLPDTGVGSVIGLFAGASALGTAAHIAYRRFLG